MNKHLLSTSAIALGVAMAAPAAAQEWNLKWGGYVNSHVGIVDVSGTGVAAGADFDGVNTFTDAEFHFRPSVTLDNGMTFGYHYELEGLMTGGAIIDESYMTISSDTLGRIILGNENSAGYLLMGSVDLPSASSLRINSNSISNFIPLAMGPGQAGHRQAGQSLMTEVAGNNDVSRITYFTPSFNGLTLGVSYAPAGDVNAGNNGPLNFNQAGRVTDIFDLGVGYKQSFNGVDLSLAARWGTGSRNARAASTTITGVTGIDPDGSLLGSGTLTGDEILTRVEGSTTGAVQAGDPTTWAIGGRVGVAGFTIGATYAENDADNATSAGNQKGWGLGVTYDIPGPWTVGFTTYQGEAKNTAGRPTSDYDVYQLSARRALGTGVSWEVGYVYAETTNGAAAGNPKIKGNLLTTGINLRF